MLGLKTLLVWTSALAGAIAVFLWYKASVVKVPHVSRSDADGWNSGGITVSDGSKETDFIGTAQLQTYWNKWASMAACVAAVAQALSLMLSEQG